MNSTDNEGVVGEELDGFAISLSDNADDADDFDDEDDLDDEDDEETESGWGGGDGVGGDDYPPEEEDEENPDWYRVPDPGDIGSGDINGGADTGSSDI